LLYTTAAQSGCPIRHVSYLKANMVAHERKSSLKS
jgi:hypothetical protein